MILKYKRNPRGFKGWLEFEFKGDKWGQFHEHFTTEVVLDGEFSLQELRDIIETMEALNATHQERLQDQVSHDQAIRG